jgi:hypothetical protein
VTLILTPVAYSVFEDVAVASGRAATGLRASVPLFARLTRRGSAVAAPPRQD